MKRISRTQGKFELMRLFDHFAKQRGISMSDPQGHDAFLSALAGEFERHRASGTLIHGLRVQAMFAYVAGALGQCVAIKEEDAGECFCDDASIIAPDFRLVTMDGEERLVEVKNHHPNDPTSAYSLGSDYFGRLSRYAAIFRRPLYFAIHWSQPKLWTLVKSEEFSLKDDHYELPLARAMMRNQMVLLGDTMVGIIPPLELKLYADTGMPRQIKEDGTVFFTIGNAELLCAGRALQDSKDREIAWFLMNYGDWPCTQAPADVSGDLLVSAGLNVSPEEKSNPGQPFECIGFLSQMLSRKFNDITAGDGRVNMLSPKQDPDALMVEIPHDYHSELLPLWRFMIHVAPHESG